MSKKIPEQRRRGDRSRIRLDEDDEVRYWSLELGVTEAELKAAVYQVGYNPEAVRQHIAGGRS